MVQLVKLEIEMHGRVSDLREAEELTTERIPNSWHYIFWTVSPTEYALLIFHYQSSIKIPLNNLRF